MQTAFGHDATFDEDTVTVYVESSTINSLTFHGDSGVVDVEFLTGKTASYEDFSKREFEEWVNAPSVGKFYNQNVKGVKKTV